MGQLTAVLPHQKSSHRKPGAGGDAARRWINTEPWGPTRRHSYPPEHWTFRRSGDGAPSGVVGLGCSRRVNIRFVYRSPPITFWSPAECSGRRFGSTVLAAISGRVEQCRGTSSSDQYPACANNQLLGTLPRRRKTMPDMERG
jgi:hypothetical protein